MVTIKDTSRKSAAEAILAAGEGCPYAWSDFAVRVMRTGRISEGQLAWLLEQGAVTPDDVEGGYRPPYCTFPSSTCASCPQARGEGLDCSGRSWAKVKGGASTSEKKAAAARANGKKGGRPKSSSSPAL